jgi:ubiquinone/menaquinone biosynthesis C-methylase UbiE
MPVSAWLVEAVGPQPGYTILDLAAGIGDTGFLAAELIQPGGTLITSDFAPEMLAAAQRRAEAKQIKNVRFRQMDLNVPLDQPAASLDGVLCRWGYMLLDDPEAALKETRRVLKPGAKVALAAWTGPDDNLWSAAPSRILQRRKLVDVDPNAPGQFTWADPHAIEETLEAAGFVEHELDAVEFAMHYADVDAWWLHVTRTSTRAADAADRMDAATRQAISDELATEAARFAQANGSLTIPARTWVVAATA